MPSDELAPDALAFLHDAIGPVHEIARFDAGEQARVFRIVDADGRRFAFKQHHDVASARREAWFYETFGPALGDMIPAWVAGRVGVGIVLEWIDGRRGDDVWTPTERQAQHRRIGEFWARCRRLPFVDRDIPLPTAIRRRADGWLRRAGPFLSERHTRELLARIDLQAFADATRTPAHRDLRPENWRVTPDGRVAVIDFGQARPDIAEIDRIKLVFEAWRVDPSLQDAFDQGAGSAPSPESHRRIDTLACLHALATFVWGHEHCNPKWIAEGESMLDRMGVRR